MSVHTRLRPSPAMVVACIALLVSLGGVSYAAVALPAGSVATKHLKKNAVTSKKVKNLSLKRQDLRPGAVGTNQLGNRVVTDAKLAKPAVHIQSAAAQAGSLFIDGTLRSSGWLRLGSETGTTDPPNFPAGDGAMIVRRAYSAVGDDDSVVARVGEATLERTGLSVQFVLDSGSLSVQVRCTGLTAGGVALDKVVDVGANSEATIYAQAENIAFFTCGLLEPGSGHYTLVTLQRVASSNPYYGYLLSTTNQ